MYLIHKIGRQELSHWSADYSYRCRSLNWYQAHAIKVVLLIRYIPHYNYLFEWAFDAVGWAERHQDWSPLRSLIILTHMCNLIIVQH